MPNRHQLAEAVDALARFHQTAAQLTQTTQIVAESPAVGQRAALLKQLQQGGWQQLEAAVQNRAADDEMRRRLVVLGQELLRDSRQLVPRLTQRIDTLAKEELILQLCHGDIHVEHVLFADEAVSGLIDFANMRVDTPLTDLARLLGSYAAQVQQNWNQGLELCRQRYDLPERELSWLRVLDDSSLVLSAANWLRWLFVEQRKFPMTRVLTRIQLLQRRLGRRR